MDSRLRRSPPDRASAVPYGQAGENAMRFPHLAHRSAAAHKLHSTPQQDRMNLISGNLETSSRLPVFSFFLPGSCPINRDRRTSDLGQLAELGYKDFKIICQNNAWHQVTTGNLAFYSWDPNQSIIRRLTKLRTLGWELYRGRKFGEAGPWGEKTSGTWHSVEHESMRACALGVAAPS